MATGFAIIVSPPQLWIPGDDNSESPTKGEQHELPIEIKGLADVFDADRAKTVSLMGLLIMQLKQN
jgi:hypothetical protein